MAEQMDRICGIDRYEHSPHRGEMTAPVAYLWNRPGAKAMPGNLEGALRHGDEVTVLEKRLVKRRLFCRVRGVAVVDGKEYPQSGWLSAALLERAGALRPGIKALEAEGATA